MSGEEKVTFTLRAMINKEETKVLFVEVDSNFADVLLSFVTLPMGTIIRLLQKHYQDEVPVIGCLNTLYNGLVNLDVSHFGTEECKSLLLNPRNSLGDELRKLKLNLDDSPPIKYFTCVNRRCWNFGREENVSIYFDTARCSECGGSMNLEVNVIKATDKSPDVFTVKSATFLISDDLQIFPNCMTSLEGLGIMDTEATTQRTLTFGFSEIMDLLRGSLFSKTPLTDLILDKRRHNSEPISFVPNVPTYRISSKMILKAMIQKSTNKFLFAVAEDDFVEFLFVSLTFPLGQFKLLLGSDICSHGSIDNLLSSIANVKRYLKTEETERMLLNPNLPPNYLPYPRVFFNYRHREMNTCNLYLYDSKSEKRAHLADIHYTLNNSVTYPAGFKDPKFMGHYLKRKEMFMVTDNLCVTPSSIFSNLAELKKLGIPSSDVEQKELLVDSEEALNILKASLVSTCALSVGLGLGSILKIQPKQEH